MRDHVIVLVVATMILSTFIPIVSGTSEDVAGSSTIAPYEEFYLFVEAENPAALPWG